MQREQLASQWGWRQIVQSYSHARRQIESKLSHTRVGSMICSVAHLVHHAQDEMTQGKAVVPSPFMEARLQPARQRQERPIAQLEAMQEGGSAKLCWPGNHHS